MRPHKGQGENSRSRDDPDNPFHSTDIPFHDTNLLKYFFGCPAFLPRPMLNVQYQRSERKSVTLSQWHRETRDEGRKSDEVRVPRPSERSDRSSIVREQSLQ